MRLTESVLVALLSLYAIASVAENSPLVVGGEADLTWIRHGAVQGFVITLMLISGRCFAIRTVDAVLIILLSGAAILGNIASGSGSSELYARLQAVPLLLVLLSRVVHTRCFFRAVKVAAWTLLASTLVLSMAHLLSGFQATTYFGVERVTLGFLHPGKLAAVAVAAYVARTVTRQKARVYGFWAIAISILSMTRNAILFMVLYWLFILTKRHKLFRVGLLLAGLYMALLGVATTDALVLNSYSSGRLYRWEEAISVNENDLDSMTLLFGRGGDAEEAFDDSRMRRIRQANTMRTDNSYLDIAVRDGVLTLVLVLALIVRVMTNAFRPPIANALLIALFIYSSFDSSLMSVGNPLFVFCVLGASVAKSRMQRF